VALAHVRHVGSSGRDSERFAGRRPARAVVRVVTGTSSTSAASTVIGRRSADFRAVRPGPAARAVITVLFRPTPSAAPAPPVQVLSSAAYGSTAGRVRPRTTARSDQGTWTSTARPYPPSPRSHLRRPSAARPCSSTVLGCFAACCPHSPACWPPARRRPHPCRPPRTSRHLRGSLPPRPAGSPGRRGPAGTPETRRCSPRCRADQRSPAHSDGAERGVDAAVLSRRRSCRRTARGAVRHSCRLQNVLSPQTIQTVLQTADPTGC
jgi:hypothetical protein